jgi:hypothetical protein
LITIGDERGNEVRGEGGTTGEAMGDEMARFETIGLAGDKRSGIGGGGRIRC